MSLWHTRRRYTSHVLSWTPEGILDPCLQVERLEKELATREAKLAEQAELISALRVDVSETALNAQVAIDDLREDLAVSAELLRASQVIARQSSSMLL